MSKRQRTDCQLEPQFETQILSFILSFSSFVLFAPYQGGSFVFLRASRLENLQQKEKLLDFESNQKAKTTDILNTFLLDRYEINLNKRRNKNSYVRRSVSRCLTVYQSGLQTVTYSLPIDKDIFKIRIFWNTISITIP